MPVLFRVTTRICHSKTLVETDDKKEACRKRVCKDAGEIYYGSGAAAKRRKYQMEERIASMTEYSEKTPLNRVEKGCSKVGIITSGISYHHAKEVFGEEALVLEAWFHLALPEKMILTFAANRGISLCY